MGLLTSTDKQKLQNKDQWIFIQLGFEVKSYVLANQENKQTKIKALVPLLLKTAKERSCSLSLYLGDGRGRE